jgi:8-amino-7-oxononanoate synthase
MRSSPTPAKVNAVAAPARSHDLFDKCRSFTRPGELQAAGLYMYFEVFGDREGCGPGEVRIGAGKVLMFGSNDYLDLITHPKVKEAAAEAVRKYGSGCSGSRLLNGTLDLHVKLEAELAGFMHKQAAIIFGTGFQANYASLAVLAEKGDALLCDHNLHASLVEGALRSTARTVRFRHNDMDHLERCLENCPPEERILMVSEGVFSMEGDIADLRGIVALAKPYGARTYVDEAHGIGVLGPTGAGAAEHLGVLEDIDIVMGTFSKSFASIGGFVASSREVIDYLKHTARPFVFSASLPAASVAAVSAALEVMRQEPERQQRLLRTAAHLRRELRAHGFPVLAGETAIVPVVVEDEVDLCRLCKALLEEGIYINPVLRPAAAQNLLRISCTAAHTEGHVERLVSTLEQVAKRLEIRF